MRERLQEHQEFMPNCQHCGHFNDASLDQCSWSECGRELPVQVETTIPARIKAPASPVKDLAPPRPAKLTFRLIFSRVVCLLAILSVWHVSDWTAATIYAVGVAIYYLPTRAATANLGPRWLRLVLAIACITVFVIAPRHWRTAPVGSFLPPVFVHALLVLLAIQMLFDLLGRTKPRAGR